MVKKDVAILDFGSEKISVIIGCSDVNNTFAIKGIGECEYAGFMDGSFLEPNNLKLAMGLAINNAELNSKTNIKELYIGVPTEFSLCVCTTASQTYPRAKTVNQNDIDELFSIGNQNFVNQRTHSVINQSAVYYVLDDNGKVTNPLGLVTNKITACMSFILAEKSFIKLIDSFLVDLEITRATYISSALAEAKYLFDEETRDRYALLVDCGYITTTVALIRGDGILSLNSFSMGGGHVTADLMECLKITFQQAESLKRKIVLSIDPAQDDVYEVATDNGVLPISAKMASEIVECRIEEIAKNILKCLNACKYEYPHYIPVSLTGGGLCYLKGAKDLLAKYLGKNVEIVVPPIPQLNKPHNSSSIGLLDIAIKQEALRKPKGLFAKIKAFINR